MKYEGQKNHVQTFSMCILEMQTGIGCCVVSTKSEALGLQMFT
jgi:hypothetical protein